ncbi:TIGR03943 family protein [Amycolatopsis sp. WAC 04169]|uniref:TIGR03943 family putative permease subunit n=1 Tax=Amycolatopsis sp. WAC 04169 TaxID=2203197 RepID=UPI000F777EC1|nr:TIGR03943 family protein [Amycolatopsis sp. WAC 04169]RSN26774.1 TIGR03943 family protein [Amycolatopsis sp. WAC 04169]
MKREAQNVLLLLVGGALIKIVVDGSYLRYVKPVMAPLLAGAGAVIVALAVIAIVRDIRAAREEAPEEPDTCGGHQHASRSPWLLMLPVLTIFLIAPPALGSDAVNRSGGRTVAAPTRDGTQRIPFPPLTDEQALGLRFVDVVTRAGWDSAGTLTDRTVRLTGFVVHSKKGKPYLARINISCCAADAFPIHVSLTGTGFEQYRDDQWLEVTGKVVPGTAVKANAYTPSLRVLGVRPIPAPADPYDY